MRHLGYYGKTLHRGDFVRFNLPQTFVTVWDEWLAQLILQGEEQYANDWSQVYQNGERYRFALSPGIAGNDAWCGLFMPSSDKVGRRFPFCIAAALPEGLAPLQSFVRLDSYFNAIEKLCNAISTNDFDFDSAQDHLASIATEHGSGIAGLQQQTFTAGIANAGEQELESELAVHADSRHLMDSNEGTAVLLDAVLQQTLCQYSLWCSCSSGQNGTTLLSSGMPTGTKGLALFSGDWQLSGCGLLQNAQLLDMQPATVDVGSSDLPPSLTDTQRHDKVKLPIELGSTEEYESEDDLEKMSTGDWSVLDDIGGDQMAGQNPASPMVIPTVEPLELEEDVNADDAPWEN